MKKIFQNPEDLIKLIQSKNSLLQRPLYVASGGFDPLHIGHLRWIQETSKLAKNKKRHPYTQQGLVVVIVNGDGFLLRKKGYAFMPASERAEIIAGIEGVDYVVHWDPEDDQTVIGALAILKPKYFTKGGDRTAPENIPEWSICQQNKTEVLFNIGGGKVQSSSTLVDNATNLEAIEMLGYVEGFRDGREK